jgi:hypothetical protein
MDLQCLLKNPPHRFGHSFNLFRNFLVVFGGAGLYNQDIKKRETFDDLILFDLNKSRWIDPITLHRDDESLLEHAIKNPNSQLFPDDNLGPDSAAPAPPLRRYGHGAAVLGCTLLIYGGINGELNAVIDDTI